MTTNPPITATCTACGTACRIPAGTERFKCPRCGAIASTSTSTAKPTSTAATKPTSTAAAKPTSTAAAKPTSTAAAKPSKPAADVVSFRGGPATASIPAAKLTVASEPNAAAAPRPDRTMLFTILAIAACAIMLLFGITALVVIRMRAPSEEQRAAAVAAERVAVEQARRDAIQYREVDLPESERQRLYRDMRIARNSTVDAKLPLAKQSQTRVFIESNLQKVLDRDAEMQSIMNNISEDDLAEIFKEGDKKGW